MVRGALAHFHIFYIFIFTHFDIYTFLSNTFATWNENEQMYTIQFRFEQQGLAPVILRNIEGEQTLLEIALKNDIKLDHQCGGVCSCTTCHLYIEKGMDQLYRMSSREEDFLTRAKNPGVHSRLGCQSLLREGTGVIEVTLPDQQDERVRQEKEEV